MHRLVNKFIIDFTQHGNTGKLYPESSCAGKRLALCKSVQSRKKMQKGLPYKENAACEKSAPVDLPLSPVGL